MATKRGPKGLSVVFDSLDPDTPVMVYIKDYKGKLLASATFFCARDETAVEHIELSDEQIDFLDGLYEQAEDFYNKYRVIA